MNTVEQKLLIIEVVGSKVNVLLVNEVNRKGTKVYDGTLVSKVF